MDQVDLPILAKPLSQRLRLAAVTLGLPIVGLAALPAVIVAAQQAAPVISAYVGAEVSPLHMFFLGAAALYTIYSYESSEGLKSGLSVIISSFLVADLIPVVKSVSVIGGGLFTYLGAAALVALVATEFVGSGRSHRRRQRRGR